MEEKNWVTKSSGEQQDFGTGAKRDTPQGKGRFDLIPHNAMVLVAKTYARFGKSSGKDTAKAVGYAIECLYSCIDKNNDDVFESASSAIWAVLEQMENKDGNRPSYEKLDGETYRFDLIPYFSIKRIADVYERGACLYGPRNWEKGMPLQRLLDSAIRHLFQYIAGKKDEDHAAQGAWNAMGFVETLWRIKHGYLPDKLDDRPELKKIKKDPLDFDGDEGNGKSLQHALVKNLDGHPSHPVSPMFYDGYGPLQFQTKPLKSDESSAAKSARLHEDMFNFDDDDEVIGELIPELRGLPAPSRPPPVPVEKKIKCKACGSSAIDKCGDCLLCGEAQCGAGVNQPVAIPQPSLPSSPGNERRREGDADWKWKQAKYQPDGK